MDYLALVSQLIYPSTVSWTCLQLPASWGSSPAKFRGKNQIERSHVLSSRDILTTLTHGFKEPEIHTYTTSYPWFQEARGYIPNLSYP